MGDFNEVDRAKRAGEVGRAVNKPVKRTNQISPTDKFNGVEWTNK
ncbi:MAG: hypothetical protein PHR96_03475 [Clostridia bacterium]|nr:hypothetical protein [Clostridia bacterium]